MPLAFLLVTESVRRNANLTQKRSGPPNKETLASKRNANPPKTKKRSAPT